MAYQRYIKPQALDRIKEEVYDSIALDRYLEDEFYIPEEDIQVIPQVNEPENLLSRMNPENEFLSAIELYRAYKVLSPVQATDTYFWESLAHLNLFQYVKKRWSLTKENLTSNYISHHWFVSSSAQVSRHTLASLWWSVFLTIDEDSSNPFELTEVLFSNKTFRTRTYGCSLVFPIKEANMGILRYILNHPELVTNFEAAGTEIYKHFNRLGAVKQLACLDRNFFYEEMKRSHDKILKAIGK